MRRKTLTRDLALCPLCPLCPLLSPECMEFSALCPFLRLLFLPDAFFFYTIAEKTFENSKGEKINEGPLGATPGQVNMLARTPVSDCFTALQIEKTEP